MMILLLLGAPGAGKGTQAEVLRDTLGMPHVSSGDLFRLHMKHETPLGLQAKAYYDRGELVPDAITIQMILDRLDERDTEQGVILDGFPRTVAQAEALTAALAVRGLRVDQALYVKVPNDTLLDRLSGRWICRNCGAVYHERYNPPTVPGVCDNCGKADLYQRVDDKRETAENRLRVYFDQTMPVIDYYRQQGVLDEINGDQHIERVTAEMMRRIRPAVSTERGQRGEVA
jgi:adenylate kinase